MQKVKRQKDPKTGLPIPLPKKEFTFRLRGHNQDIPAGTYMAEDEYTAFKMARQKVGFLEFPGWSLHCVDTGTTAPAVEFMDDREKDERGRPIRKWL